MGMVAFILVNKIFLQVLGVFVYIVILIIFVVSQAQMVLLITVTSCFLSCQARSVQFFSVKFLTHHCPCRVILELPVNSEFGTGFFL